MRPELEQNRAVAAAAALPEWARTALQKGASMRIAKPWPREKLRPEDFIAGTVTERTQSKLVLALEAGTLAGEELEPGDWRRVHLSGVLVSWVECDEPVVGEKVVIRYLGRFGLGDKPTFDFACAVHREPPPAPWE